MKRKDSIFVLVQICLLVFFLIPIGPRSHISIGKPVGIVGMIFGGMMVLGAMYRLGKSLTPFPTPADQSELVQQGWYRRSRHPIYAGILMATMGWILWYQSLFHAIAWILLAYLFFEKSKYEEELLINRYGESYRRYQEKVRRFL